MISAQPSLTVSPELVDCGVEELLNGAERLLLRSPRGITLNCKGLIQEAALRMLLNNLDPEVAENPQELIVY